MSKQTGLLRMRDKNVMDSAGATEAAVVGGTGHGLAIEGNLRLYGPSPLHYQFVAGARIYRVAKL